jgi:hypothetical protein
LHHYGIKSVFRWVFGDGNIRGFRVLKESMRSGLASMSHLGLTFCVCYNGSKPDRVRRLCEKNGVLFHLQKPDESYPWPHRGSFWKLCPPRVSDGYEIVCDNDAIIRKCPTEIEKFMGGSVPFISGDYIFAFGRYRGHIGKPLNSGLYGLPPGWKFQDSLVDSWRLAGSEDSLRPYSDEQGLISMTITKSDHIEIPPHKICFASRFGSPVSAEYRDDGSIASMKFDKPDYTRDVVHFVGINSEEKTHLLWKSCPTRKIFM